MVPTGRDVDGIMEGLDEMLRFRDDVEPAIERYVRHDIEPQFARAAAAIGPIIREGKARTSYEATRAENVALSLSSEINGLTTQLARSMATGGGDSPTIANRAASKVDALVSLVNTLGWKDQKSLGVAQRELTELKRRLQWETIESKVGS